MLYKYSPLAWILLDKKSIFNIFLSSPQKPRDWFYKETTNMKIEEIEEYDKRKNSK